MAAKASSGVWSTEKVVVKFWLLMVLSRSRYAGLVVVCRCRRSAVPRRTGGTGRCSCGFGRRIGESRKLTLERLEGAATPRRSQRRRHGIREDLLLAVRHAVEDGAGDGLRGGLRDGEVSGHLGIHGAGQDGMRPHALPGQHGP